jgi:hypothetical protein
MVLMRRPRGANNQRSLGLFDNLARDNTRGSRDGGLDIGRRRRICSHLKNWPKQTWTGFFQPDASAVAAIERALDDAGSKFTIGDNPGQKTSEEEERIVSVVCDAGFKLLDRASCHSKGVFSRCWPISLAALREVLAGKVLDPRPEKPPFIAVINRLEL